MNSLSDVTSRTLIVGSVGGFLNLLSSTFTPSQPKGTPVKTGFLLVFPTLFGLVFLRGLRREDTRRNFVDRNCTSQVFTGCMTHCWNDPVEDTVERRVVLRHRSCQYPVKNNETQKETWGIQKRSENDGTQTWNVSFTVVKLETEFERKDPSGPDSC